MRRGRTRATRGSDPRSGPVSICGARSVARSPPRAARAARSAGSCAPRRTRSISSGTMNAISASLDARAADDRSRPSAKRTQRLALAVVVGRPDDERRRLAADRARLVALRLVARASTRTNGFYSHSRPIVVSSVWPGRTRSSGGSGISTSITDRRTVADVAAADRVLEQRVAREETVSVDDERHTVVRVARASQCARRRVRRSRRAALDLDPEPPDELVVARDVVGVAVRQQQVRARVSALPLHDREQRLERRAAVDEHGSRRPARPRRRTRSRANPGPCCARRSRLAYATRESDETRRMDGRLDVTRLDGGEGEALEAARPRGGSERDARLLVREATASCSRT